MRLVLDSLLGGLLAAAAIGTAVAQPLPPAKPPVPPASAPEPMTAASRQIPTRNTAITASEYAKEPGNQRPEERVIPQISIPLKNRSIDTADTPASAPPGSVPGRVNDGAARCMAISNAGEKAACERSLGASSPARR